METKVEQWGRKGNKIYLMTKELEHMYWKEEIDKIANIPQELIENGDLVETLGEEVSYEKIYEPKYFGMIETIDLEFDQICCTGGVILSLNDIVKILTPNRDGGFDLQYSKEETE